MGAIKFFYKRRHPDVQDDDLPYWCKFSLWQGVKKITRKFFAQSVIPFIPFNHLRVIGYRLCGFKIGKVNFIGMRCYFDDLCYDKIQIGDDVTISYGVYFACHGKGQVHNNIVIKDGAYIGMRASIIAPKNIVIGEGAIVGAMTLVNKDIPAGRTAVGIPCRILENHKKSTYEHPDD